MDILIVESEKKIVKVLCDSVTEIYPGSQFHVFADAKQALEFANSQPVDICFTEVKAGRVSGFAVAKAVREINEDVLINFIADCKDYALDAWKLHVNDYLLKPITRESILHAICK